MSIIGVIAGSGLYEMPGLKPLKNRKVRTPYGSPSAPYKIGEMEGVQVAFLPRHGSPHHIPPAQVNYRANIWGFKKLGVERIISVNATGGINPRYRHGDIVVTDQVLDMTQGARKGSYYDKDEVVHVDFTEPYCPEVRRAVLEAGARAGIKLQDGGTYVCVNGPRLESRAEIKFFASIGADLVGMTAMPEAALARELEMCMACVSVVTNYAAGTTGARLTTTEVVEVMKEASEKLKTLLSLSVPLIPPTRKCRCKDALKEARL